MYHLEMGEHEHQIAQMASRMKRRLPERIENAPELEFGNELYLQAFMDLSSCRNSPYGAMPISYFDMVHYSMINDFSSDQFEMLLSVIPPMDSEYTKVMEKKQKAKTPLKKGKRKR